MIPNLHRFLKIEVGRLCSILIVFVLLAIPMLVSIEKVGASDSSQLNYVYINDDKEVMIIKRLGLSGLVIIPDAIDGRPVTAIGDRAFSDLTGLRSLSIPSSVKSIGANAFSGCTALSSVSLPRAITAIGNYAFYRCQSLREIRIPEGVMAIGGDAFKSCSSLASITFPENLTAIGDSAFRYCTALTSIWIPANVTNIAGGYWSVFGGCSSLRSIDVDPDSASFTSVDGVLFSKDMTRMVQFPPGRGGSYAIPEGVVNIDAGAFDYCTKLVTLNLSSSVASLGTYFPFSGCSGLQAINVNVRNMNYASAGGVLYDKQMTDVIYRPGEDAPTNYSWPIGLVLIFGFLAFLAGIVVLIKAYFFVHMLKDVVTGKDTGGVQEYMEFQTTMAILNNANQSNWDKKGK